jgi:hypothetical protein
MTDYFEDDEGNIPVEAPSGALFHVLVEAEKEYFEDVANRYMADNQFINVSDVQDLDRVLMMELLVYRWSSWLTNETDYQGMSVDPIALNKSIKDFSSEIRLMKKALGMDKATREKDKGESVHEYIDNLGVRAKAFGYMRDMQHARTIELFQDLKALIEFFDNCTPEERKENSVEMEDIMEWCREIAIPEFDSIDLEFRKEQKMWIRSQ